MTRGAPFESPASPAFSPRGGGRWGQMGGGGGAPPCVGDSAPLAATSYQSRQQPPRVATKKRGRKRGKCCSSVVQRQQPRPAHPSGRCHPLLPAPATAAGPSHRWEGQAPGHVWPWSPPCRVTGVRVPLWEGESQAAGGDGVGALCIPGRERPPLGAGTPSDPGRCGCTHPRPSTLSPSQQPFCPPPSGPRGKAPAPFASQLIAPRLPTAAEAAAPPPPTRGRHTHPSSGVSSSPH